MSRLFSRFALLSVFLLSSFPVFAEDGGDAATTAAPAAVEVSEALRTPQASMITFLGAMNDVKRGDETRIVDALTVLDLSDVNALVRTERGEHLAWTLLEVMDRTRSIDTGKIPDYQLGEPWVFEKYSRGRVRISRMEDGAWRFDADTMARLPLILEELADRERVAGLTDNTAHLPLSIRLEQGLPDSLKQTTFLLENWRWLALLILVAVGVIVDWAVSLLLRTLMRGWVARHKDDFAETDVNMLRPLGLMAMAVIWWLGITLLALPETALLIFLVAVKFLASISGVWAAYRLVDLIGTWLLNKAERSNNKLDDVLAPLVPRTLKIFVTVIGVVFVADNLNIDISGLLAGLGLGGLAFALAAKDMVQNLFGSITVLLDRTFTVGDWIVVGDDEGTVERMGFRSTRLRTFYNSLVTVPNSVFITAEVDNMGARRYRRYTSKFGLAYDTDPDRIEAFCEGVRELVRQHPYMRKDYFHVYLNDLGASSLDVLVYVFWETPDWGTELRERQRFLLDCLRLAQELEIEYAFPTQTLYLRQEAMPDQQSPELDQQAMLEQARNAARSVVSKTTGLNHKPPPVTF